MGVKRYFGIFIIVSKNKLLWRVIISYYSGVDRFAWPHSDDLNLDRLLPAYTAVPHRQISININVLPGEGGRTAAPTSRSSQYNTMLKLSKMFSMSSIVLF